MLSPPVGALIANASVPNTEINLSTTAGTEVAAVPDILHIYSHILHIVHIAIYTLCTI